MAFVLSVACVLLAACYLCECKFVEGRDPNFVFFTTVLHSPWHELVSIAVE